MIVRTKYYGKDDEKLDSDETKKELFSRYIGLEVDDIFRELGENPDLNKNKSRLPNLAKRLSSSMTSEIEKLRADFNRTEISIRTVNVRASGRPIQLMSLDTIDFIDLVELPWEENPIHNRFKNTLFIILVFRTDSRKHTIFLGDKTWVMPEDDLQGKVREFWERLRKSTERGDVEAFPKQGADLIVHVKAKGGNSAELGSLPNGEAIPKQGLWLNANYIASMVEDIHLRKTTIRAVDVKRRARISAAQRTSLSHVMTEEGYTIEDFVSIIQKEIEGYDVIHLTASDADALGYRLDKELVFKSDHLNSSEYLSHLIFSNDYLNVDDHPPLQTKVAQRFLKNMERLSRIVSLGRGIYITEKCLSRAGISEENISDFRESVESYVVEKEFFTLQSIRNSGHHHELYKLGFEEDFYECILLRIGILKNLSLGKYKKKIFVKQIRKPSLLQLIKWLMQGEKEMNLEDMQEEFSNRLNIDMMDMEIIHFIERSGYFYSSDLEKVFLNKKEFLDSVYGEDTLR